MIADAEGNIVQSESLGSNAAIGLERPSKERYNPESDLVEVVRTSFAYDGSTKILKVQVEGDEYEALNVTQIGPRYFYKKGDLVSEASVKKSLDCKILGSYQAPIDGILE